MTLVDVFVGDEFGIVGGLAQDEDRQQSGAFGAQHVLDELELLRVFLDGLLAKVGLARVADDVRLFKESFVVLALHNKYVGGLVEETVTELVIEPYMPFAETEVLTAVLFGITLEGT